MPIATQHTEIPAQGATPVSREYVHKLDEAEVLLTSWRPVAPDMYVVTARWPRHHSFYAARNGLHDPLLLAESIRQAIPLLSHVAYDVPFGHRQSWSHFTYSLTPAALAAGDAPAEVELHIACLDVIRRAGRLASMTMQISIWRDGALLGTAQAGFLNLSPAIYQRTRGEYADLDRSIANAVPLAPPMPPARVAREEFADVVLSPTDTPNLSQLRVDLSHAVLFDHRVDHAPGMLLLEAARQSAHAATFPRQTAVVGMETVFTRYAELDAPCWIQADPLPDDEAGRARVLVSALQNDICIFSTVATLETVPENR
ncbi:ScbA/BarX family gamma-butyrolactone biosynthesis protein [Streptomyces sp. NPDC050738]|uniref:ScbA/BarX family gamma-butyrolactone biosynthesis protein n=1 Tax=Streptomyces sp. NPDC050738 TaxID=3154744 RepID=UPI00342AC17D